MAPTRTRTPETALEQVLSTILMAEEYRHALAEADVVSIDDLMCLTDSDVDDLCFQPPATEEDSEPDWVHLKLMQRRNLKNFLVWTKNNDVDDINIWWGLTRTTIRNYNRELNKTTPVSGNSTSTKSTTTSTSALQFMNSVKKSVTDYKALNDDKYWKSFNFGLKTTAASHNISEVFDPSFVPNADQVELFESQKKFALSVLNHVLKTARSRKILRDHEKNPDPQLIYKDLLEAYSS